jgi:hypothetical protein
MPNKNRTRNKANIGYKPTMVPVKRVKVKKDNILIEVAKDQVIRELINGFEVIKPVKRYGKYYVLVKNK